MKPILSDNEIMAAINKGSTIGGTLISMDENFAKQMRSIALASQKTTLKAVGKWLEKAIEKSINQGQLHRGAEAFKQGKFPEGAQP